MLNCSVSAAYVAWCAEPYFRLNDDMFSKEDVEEFVDFLKGSIKVGALYRLARSKHGFVCNIELSYAEPHQQ